MITLILIALVVLMVMGVLGRPVNTAKLATDCAVAACILAIVGLATVLGLALLVLAIAPS